MPNVLFLGFLRYFDTISEVLGKFGHLRLGGPGGNCANKFSETSYCWSLLSHIANTSNAKLDYISIHKKVRVNFFRVAIFHRMMENFYFRETNQITPEQ